MAEQPLDYFQPPRFDAMTSALRALRKTRRICGFITLAALIFGGVNSGDRNPLQWWGILVFMGCLFVYLFTVAATWVASQIQIFLNRSSRPQKHQQPTTNDK
jgi:hypothetical protein